MVPLQKLESGQPVEKSERAEKQPQAQRVELPTGTSYARLNYDADTNEVVVEILNPQTGEVLQRLPAEEMSDDIIRALNGGAGPLVDTYA